MDGYLLPNEIAMWAPRSADDTLIADETGQIRFILQASEIIDGATRNGTLEISPVYDEDIRLDAIYSGKLARTPFVEWIGTTGTVNYFGDTNSGESLTLSEFSVEPVSGTIRNLAVRPGTGGFDRGFTAGRGHIVAASPYAENLQQYHAATANLIQDNSRPFVMRASYRAGWFCEQIVAEVAAIGAESVVLEDVTGLARGREFYFGTTEEAELVKKRTITAVDQDSLTVTFSPALTTAVAVGDALRMIDRRVRAACGAIIEELLVYPANTKDFSEGLGKGDLSNRWIRINDGMLPVAAAAMLAKYVR